MASAAPTTTAAAAAAPAASSSGGGAVDLPVNAKAVKAAADAAGQKGLMNKVFSSVPIASLPRPKAGGVVVIPSDATIKEAVAILTKHDILAAPVRDVDCKLASPSWSDLYLGLFDMTDVVMAAIAMDSVVGKGLPGLDETTTTLNTASLLKVMWSNSYFTSTTVKDVLHTFQYGPFVPLEEDDSTTLLDAALILGKYGQHRVVIVQPTTGDGSKEVMKDVVREDRRLLNIVTQSTLIGLIASKEFASKLGPIASKTLEELHLAGPSEVLSVSMNDSVLNAFTIIATNGISAVSVLDDSGNIVGVVSNRDARAVSQAPNALSVLHGPVRNMLVNSHKGDVDIRSPGITVKTTDTLGHVIQKLAATRIHRIFVVKPGTNTPVAVISLRDVLNVLVQEPTPDYFNGFFDATSTA